MLFTCITENLHVYVNFFFQWLQKALFSLRKSLAGYVSAMTRACQQIDPLLVDY